MMMNLFTIFDPSTNMNMSMNWSLITMIFMIITFNFWYFPSKLQQLNMNFNLFIKMEMMNMLTKKNLKMNLIMMTMILFIMYNNLMGLFPYIFTITSHLIITLTLALPLWICLMLFGWITLTNNMFKHLLPLGTPMLLSTFMVIIETISSMIRPITLSIRLMANMVAGHLLLTLLTNLSENNYKLFLPTFMMILLLLILEYAVAMIQSYVFMTLLSLYLNEIM